MAIFPYNNHKYSKTDFVNGSPLDIGTLYSLSDKLIMWHYYANTADWSQSSDTHHESCNRLAAGLMELFSDPNALRRIMLTGEGVSKRVNNLLTLDVKAFERHPMFIHARKTMFELFNLSE